jgi:hypothetical protein
MHTLAHLLARWLPPALAAKLGAAPGEDKPAATHLTAENLRLWVRSGARCSLGEYVASSSDYLVPEFTLRTVRPETPPPPEERLLTLSLLQGSSRTPIGRRSVSLNGEAVRFRGPSIPVGSARYFPHPGHYCLVASVADREVARFPFQVVGRQELGKQVKVTQIHIEAEKLDGQKVPGLRVFRRDEHQAILPALRVETGILAPNTLVPCSVQAQQGSAIVGREEFLLPLDRSRREVKLKRIELSAANFAGRSKPTRFMLAVYVAGELKAVKPLLLLPSDRIANREGQLLQDAKDLPLDDLEYDQILTGLAIPPPPPVPRRLWR